MKVTVTSKRSMNDFVRQIARSLHGGEVLALEGTLGAGKTYFTQQLAKALGVKEVVTSPTFVLMNVYNVPGNRLQVSGNIIKYLVHVDCYRLEDPKELLAIGITDWLGRPDTAVVVEWADKAREVLKPFRKNTRTIRFSVSGHARTVTM